MKIKKTDKSVGILGKILNKKSESEINTYSANYLNDRLVKVSPTEPETGEEVWIKKGKNLISGFRHNYMYHNGNSVYETSAYGFTATYPIDIELNVPYYFSHALGVRNGNVNVIDSAGKCLEQINADDMLSPIIITNPKAKQIIINTWDINNNTVQNETWMQLEQGNGVTPYEPYIEKEIYIKNKNDIYERFESYVVEHGHTENGEYIKYADGTMECRIRHTGPTFASTRKKSESSFYYDDSDGKETGNVYRWTFPQEFISSDDLVVTLTVGSAAYTMASHNNSSTTGVVCYCVTPYPVSSIQFTWHVVAKGRWK